MIITSCGLHNNDTRIEKFPKTVSISGNTVKDIELTTDWAHLVVVDTFLVIQKTEAPFINIFSTNTHKLLSEFGAQGSGPNEFEMPDLLKQIFYDQGNNSPVISLYDIITRRISRVNILKTIYDEDNAIEQERIPELNDVLVYFFHKDDSLLLATPEVGGRFVTYNYTSSRKKYTPFIPELDVEMKDDTKSTIYRSFVAVNKKRNRFVAAPTFLNELNFFDLQGNYINSTIISPRDNLTPPLGNQSLPSGIKRYFASLEEVDHKIYTLKTGADEGKIQVFDWDGNPLEQYLFALSSRVGSFAYDKNHQQFYVYFPDEEPYNIYTYPLN